MDQVLSIRLAAHGGVVAARDLHDAGVSEQTVRTAVRRGELIRVLAAYNAGPGNLQRWQPANRHRDDPFLFIEAIPYDETRAYVQRVLAYSWIYASRLGLPAPSLDALAAGAFPRFMETAEVEAMLRRSPVRTAAN